jgi:hypothetical protein
MSAIDGNTSWAAAHDVAVIQTSKALDNTRATATLARKSKENPMRALALCLALVAGPALSHEFWLEPLAYQVPADGRLEANIVNGQFFEGIKLAYVPQRIARFAIYAGGEVSEIQDRAGNTPGLNQPALADGLNVVVYQSTVSTVTYENWEKFQRFVVHKDFGDVLTRHRERGLPEENFKEAYTRYSKTLIGVGDGTGSDLRTGLETEIVALTNPYTDDLSAGMRVQLFYGEAVRADTQVEIFEKAPDGSVLVTTTRTDADGIATIPVKPGHAYMLDAEVLREPTAELAAETEGVWETLWANLTFMAP